MIKNQNPLSMAEVAEYVKDGEKDEGMEKFIKKFTKLSPKKAKETRSKLEKLEILKMKPEHIVKIIDLVPENQEDLNKIFLGVGLDEDETKKILDAIKQTK
ncbi:MAG: hypothetical protein AABX28_02965 [Nanoarchaeota archaeon]